MLAIVTSHPIQYQAALWRALAADGRIPFEVWFLTPHAVEPSPDREFGRTFAWDVDLLSGYRHRFLDVHAGWRLDRFGGIRLRRPWNEELRSAGVSTLWLEGWRFRTLWSAAASARGAGAALWLRGETHDLGPRRPGPRAWLRQLALRWLFRRTDRFLCIGTANRRFYERSGIPADRLAPAPYAVDVRRFSEAAGKLRPERAALRRRWQIADDAFVALFCGKLIEKKRPLDLVAAARLAPRVGGRPLHLLFVGDGELAPAVRAALAATGAPPATLAGFLNQSEMPAAFVAADCLVLPSDHRETWGLVVNEGLACGLPPLVSDRCGCAEDLAAPLGDPHVFRFGDIGDLAARLSGIAARPPSPAALDSLSSRHAPERTAETVAALLAPA
ncbi:MAG TPA: glycosyltransferase family 4 protein [Opitutaceae bacterium]|nr:glycosyltransferase family 4 protein [Opitutaceae bacterium]